MKRKKLLMFARIEHSDSAKLENVSGDWNKKIVFYITDGKKIAKINEETYTIAKERFYKKRIIFIPEETIEKPSITQDVSSIKLIRYV